MTVRFVTIKRAAEITGYTAAAIQKKIERGEWARGRECVTAPDGRTLIDLENYEKWAKSNLKASTRKRTPFRSGSAGTGEPSAPA